MQDNIRHHEALPVNTRTFALTGSLTDTLIFMQSRVCASRFISAIGRDEPNSYSTNIACVCTLSMQCQTGKISIVVLILRRIHADAAVWTRRRRRVCGQRHAQRYKYFVRACVRGDRVRVAKGRDVLDPRVGLRIDHAQRRPPCAAGFCLAAR